jgi:hypothetical protein
MKNFIKGFAVWVLLLICCYGGMAQPPKLVRAEYYIDSDPGYGKATAMALSSLPAISVSFDITKLSSGPHVVGMRSQDSIGSWSLDNKWILVKLSQSDKETRAPKLIRTEYYINNAHNSHRLKPGNRLVYTKYNWVCLWNNGCRHAQRGCKRGMEP